MRCCKKISSYLRSIVILLTMLACAPFASADGISISKAELRLVDDSYIMQADFNITLPPSVVEALQHGVTLNFVSELEITQSRWYWLDSAVIQSEQTTKLSYNALTRQYRISRGNLYQGFSSLESALRLLGHQALPAIPRSALSAGGGYVASLLKSQTEYIASAKMRLDIAQLPKPIQVNALTNSEWNLASEKHIWPVSVETTDGSSP